MPAIIGCTALVTQMMLRVGHGAASGMRLSKGSRSTQRNPTSPISAFYITKPT
jgi:hypothetical protein